MDDVRLSTAQTDHLARLHRAVRERAARDLSGSDAQVLRWREEGLTFAQIAERLGVNRSRAHQIVTGAKKRQAIRTILEKERYGRHEAEAS